MNQLRTKSFTCGLAALLTVVLLSASAWAQMINVTMRFNAATNRDTLGVKHVAQLRGEATGTVTPAITWGGDTGLLLQNKGGDYWETTFQIQAGAIMRYKLWTGFNGTTGTFFWDGWEGPINPANPMDSGDNRLFIAGTKDTTLALQFYNGTDTRRDQYWRPYAAKPDTFVVYLRANLGAYLETGDFNPDAGDRVVVRGSSPLDATNSWNTDITLTREAGSADGAAFYSGTGYIANSTVTNGVVQNFKFVYIKGTSLVWESTPNRFFTYSGARDTTIHWSYYNNQKPSGGNIVSATLTWQMNAAGLEKLGLFDRSVGDQLVVDGAKAWDVANAIQLNYVPLLKLWVGQEAFTKAPGAVMEYKTVLLWDASRADPASPNYLPGLDLTAPLQYWEEPAVTGTGNRNYVYSNQVQQNVPGDYGFAYQFFNGLPEQGVITTPLTVTFNINMAPAANIATNPSNPLFRPGIDTVSVQFYGCLLPLTQGDGLYTNTPLQLADPEGDLVYSGTMNLTPPFPYDVGYRINYTAGAGVVIQNGGGFTKGRSYYQYIHPTSVAANGTITWPAQYSFPTLQWLNSDLTVEDPPDLFNPTRVADPAPGAVIKTFALSQNYPNPFSAKGGAVTRIDYQLASKSPVEIDVYNLMGQLITSLVHSQQERGAYSVNWNGRDANGHEVPAGLYFMKMAAGSFEQLRKIALLH